MTLDWIAVGLAVEDDPSKVQVQIVIPRDSDPAVQLDALLDEAPDNDLLHRPWRLEPLHRHGPSRYRRTWWPRHLWPARTPSTSSCPRTGASVLDRTKEDARTSTGRMRNSTVKSSTRWLAPTISAHCRTSVVRSWRSNEASAWSIELTTVEGHCRTALNRTAAKRRVRSSPESRSTSRPGASQGTRNWINPSGVVL